ncbi:AAA family ATPase [Parathalassolituus penaei]|uniref:AAA family ATPase n=1 Tax=Parathalassolituus penaei TaxID=2997323 RepID=A0A9X3EI48_9GAMM|nr:ATP-binding protein [Parathalassolituus penaei]MCY0967159.1 AAA family ATPase [Parathalassolituus penaei]
MIEKLHLKNFTAFDDLELKLSPKINVIIGENGTGKTQLLKALYFCNKALASQTPGAEDLLHTFRPSPLSLKELVGNDGKAKAEVHCELATGQAMDISFSANSRQLVQDRFMSNPPAAKPTFLPAKEVLSFLKGMSASKLTDVQNHGLFDQTYLDLISKLLVKAASKPGEKIDDDPRFADVYLKLVEVLGGKFEVMFPGENLIIRFNSGEYERVKDESSPNFDQMTFRKRRSDSMDMTAEGLRKLGNLQLLLANHELVPGSGGVLLWDEPEANLNPKLMKLVVETLLQFARNGQQIVVATHDYVLLKWFDLLIDSGKGDHIRYHGLSRDEDGKISIEVADDYKYLSTNAISNTFSELYDAEIQRSLGGS